MKKLIFVAFVLFCVSALWAKPGVSLTVYNDNLALVRDTRMIEFKSGTDEIKFSDVSGQIDATSVHFKATGVALLEQNFDYDLVSPDKLLRKYVDQRIEIVSEKGDLASGILLVSATSGGQLVIKQDDGSLRSILLAKAAEIRYPKLPEGLITRPTLRWLVNANGAGKKETEVSYLTTGLSWQADYVLVVSESSNKADLDAWVTLNNTCGTDYMDAQLKLIAGEVHRAQQPPQRGVMMMAADVSPKAARQFEERTFFEYHLYTMQRPTSVLDQQTKQISLFPLTTVATKRIYEYDWRRKQDNVGVSVEFENNEENRLGIPLPAGRVRVYQQDTDGSQEFVGEDNIDHTPKNEKVRVLVGEAFDIAVERNQTDLRRISPAVTETDYEVKLRNHKKEAVEIIVLDYFWGDWKVMRSSLPSNKVTSTKLEFHVTVEPEQEAVLTYTIRQQ